MKIFIDSANIDEIKKASEWGIIDGVTTNPSLIAREKKDFKTLIMEITGIVEGHVSVEGSSTDADGLVKEAVEIAGWSRNIVVKIPMIPEGLKAVRILNAKNIKTNVTLIFSVNQALLAAKAGATCVSPFIGRLEDTGSNGMQIVDDIVKIFDYYHLKSEVIVASIRNPRNVIDAAKAGAHATTVPFKVIEQMFIHPLTDTGLKKFLNDWGEIEKCMRQ